MEFMADEEIGDLYVITFMPTPAHDSVVAKFTVLFESYQQLYKSVLWFIFPRVNGLDPDGGMALYANDPRDGIVYHRTVLLEVEKSHRSLPELIEHMIQQMKKVKRNGKATICYGIGIKINQRQQDQLFSAVCLLFKRDANNNPYCFHAHDFGTAAITAESTNMLQKLSIPIAVPIPYRVTLDENRMLLPSISPWNTPTFSIPGQFIFGNSREDRREDIVLGGITLTIPDDPTDLGVDLFMVLECINLTLPVFK
jgi:hypothetical protein